MKGCVKMSDGINPKDVVVDMSKLCGNNTGGKEQEETTDLSNVKPITVMINEGADLLNSLSIKESEKK